MKFTILTLFPEMFAGQFAHSIINRARQKKLIALDLVNIRDFAIDRHRSVDSRPYGGGVGMLLRADVVHRALKYVLEKNPVPKTKTRIIITDPRGRTFTQKRAVSWQKRYGHLVIICGHYEGFDERIFNFVDERISLGKFILSGGEPAAAVMLDAVTRLLPSALNDPQSNRDETFAVPGVYEYPQYTKPREYLGLRVPDVLLSGNHKLIAEWKTQNRGKPKKAVKG